MDLIKASEPSRLTTCLMMFGNMPRGSIKTAAVVIKQLKIHKKFCDDIGLRISSTRLDVIVDALSNSEVLPHFNPTDLVGLEQIMREELQTKWFYYVPGELAHYYQAARPFGDKVYDAFPSASYDCIEASKCLALSRPTACVFHCMRALELVLKSFAKYYGVRKSIYLFDQEQSIINAIVGKINAKKAAINQNKKKKRAKTRSRGQSMVTFGAELVIRLEACKDAWRNNVAHARSKYTEDEARQIYDAVKRLMEDAATRLREVP